MYRFAILGPCLRRGTQEQEMPLSPKVHHVLARFEELEKELSESHNLDPKQLAALSKEHSDLSDLAEKIKEYDKKENELQYLAEMLEDPNVSDELIEIADQEILDLKKDLPELEQEIKLLLLPKDPADEKSAILEVRAGTGGDEAGLFAAELFRMYQRFASINGWRFEQLSFSDTGVGGLKEASASITGTGAFGKLKYESGVHRVQRIPKTESGGRIHTSAATVAVLPEAEEVDIQIEEKDLKIDYYRASGPGGQSVNTTDSAVRITHVPTGVVVQQQDEKSQHKNKAKALKILRSRVYEAERAKADSERADSRKSLVGSGDRSERIRTYNFPQGRVTDHRINLTLYKIEQIMEGEGLSELITALITEDQASLLSEAE